VAVALAQASPPAVLAAAGGGPHLCRVEVQQPQRRPGHRHRRGVGQRRGLNARKAGAAHGARGVGGVRIDAQTLWDPVVEAERLERAHRGQRHGEDRPRRSQLARGAACARSDAAERGRAERCCGGVAAVKAARWQHCGNRDRAASVALMQRSLPHSRGARVGWAGCAALNGICGSLVDAGACMQPGQARQAPHRTSAGAQGGRGSTPGRARRNVRVDCPVLRASPCARMPSTLTLHRLLNPPARLH
jgi:hypothetical protein